MSTHRKNILGINFFPSFTPPGSGGELRYYHLYRCLREYYDINLINPTNLFVEPETVHHFPDMIEHRVPKNKHHLMLHRLFNRIGKFPECSAVVVMLASYFNNSQKTKIDEFLPEADIVIHECPFLINLAPKKEGQILIYDSYNVEYDLHRDMLKGIVGRFLCAWVKKLERKACRSADFVLATSEEDKLRFINLYDISPRKIILVPNGVDPDEIKPASPEERRIAREHLNLGDKAALLFFGSAHPPNIEAVEFIISSLAPLLPDVNFMIAGNICDTFKGRDAVNVHLLGRVSDEDKKYLLQGVDIALNPMFSGSGTNLKMFDYMSAGIPVISTPTGARGIPLRTLHDAIITESYGFLNAINQILANSDLSGKLSKNGRNMVEEKFHWKNLAKRVHQAILSLENTQITVINDFSILPPRHGGQYRILSLYSRLASYIPVNYLYLEKETDDIEINNICENFTLTAIPKTFFQRVFESIMGRFFGFSVDDILSIFFAPRNRIMKREIAQAAKFGDVLISCHPYMWKLIDSYTDRILIYESLNYECCLKKDILKGFIGNLLVRAVKRIETLAVKHSSAVFTVSSDEAQVLANDFCVDGKFITIPNGTDCSDVYIPSKEEKQELRNYLGLNDIPVALFIGSAHPPNVNAGEQIIKKVAPQCPGVLFIIIGSVCWMLKDIPERPENVKLFFEVEENIRNDFFKIADIAVNPMMTGAGTSLKMFDFLAAGLPVVSTPLGARGVAENENDFCLLRDVSDFPETVNSLCSDSSRQEILRKKGRIYVEENFDWNVIACKMFSHIQGLMKKK
jgi:glycosyltransferase involved in cell wall biosynthesis